MIGSPEFYYAQAQSTTRLMDSDRIANPVHKHLSIKSKFGCKHTHTHGTALPCSGPAERMRSADELFSLGRKKRVYKRNKLLIYY